MFVLLRFFLRCSISLHELKPFFNALFAVSFKLHKTCNNYRCVCKSNECQVGGFFHLHNEVGIGGIERALKKFRIKPISFFAICHDYEKCAKGSSWIQAKQSTKVHEMRTTFKQHAHLGLKLMTIFELKKSFHFFLFHSFTLFASSHHSLVT